MIDLIEDQMPPCWPVYCYSKKELNLLKEFIKDIELRQFIYWSTSPTISLTLFIQKKNIPNLHLYVNYWALNKITVKNRYPVPPIDSLLNRLYGAQYFTKINLREAFYLLRIQKSNKWKTAFWTSFSLFQFLVMPFGLCNIPTSFYSYVDQALKRLKDKPITYLDNILVYSTTLEELHIWTRHCLQCLRENKLIAKLKKYKFEITKLRMQDFVVNKKDITIESKRVNMILDWPELKTLTQVQKFIGFVNFYHRFIFNISDILKPIIDLTRKNAQPFK